MLRLDRPGIKPTEAEAIPTMTSYRDHGCLRRFPDGTSDVLVVCPCGAVGEPAQLKWSGDRCGRCAAITAQDNDSLPLTVLRTDNAVAQVHLAASGHTLIAVGTTKQQAVVTFWEWPTRRKLATHTAPLFLTPGLVPFASDGREGVLDGRRNWIEWDLDNGRVVHEVPSDNQFRSLALSPDGQIAAGLRDQALHIIRRNTPATDTRVVERELLVDAHPLGFSPDGSTVAVGTARTWVCLVDSDTGEVERILHDQPRLPQMGLASAYVRCLAYSPDGCQLIAGCGQSLDDVELQPDAKGWVLLWDCDSELPFARLSAHGGSVNAVAFSPDGAVIASGDEDGVLSLWDAHNGQPLAALEGHHGAILSLCFAADGEAIVTGGADHSVRFWPWRKLLMA